MFYPIKIKRQILSKQRDTTTTTATTTTSTTAITTTTTTTTLAHKAFRYDPKDDPRG